MRRKLYLNVECVYISYFLKYYPSVVSITLLFIRVAINKRIRLFSVVCLIKELVETLLKIRGSVNTYTYNGTRDRPPRLE
jgi:hypothetical protein